MDLAKESANGCIFTRVKFSPMRPSWRSLYASAIAEERCDASEELLVRVCRKLCEPGYVTSME